MVNGVHKTCTETATISHGTSHVTTKQLCDQSMPCKAIVTHSVSYDKSINVENSATVAKGAGIAQWLEHRTCN